MTSRLEAITSNVKNLTHIAEPRLSGSRVFNITPNAVVEIVGARGADGNNMVIDFTQTKITLTHNGKTATVNASLGNPTKVFVFRNAVCFADNDDFFLVGVDTVTFDPEVIKAIITPHNSASIVFGFDQMQDEFLATYLETDNTVLGGIMSLIANRPAFIDTTRENLRVRAAPLETTITVDDVKGLNIQTARSKPSRGVIFAEDVLPFDAGGNKLGVVPINIKCNTTPGWYAKKWVQQHLNPKVSFIVLNETVLNDVRVGDIITLKGITRQGRGREKTPWAKVLVTSFSVTIRHGGTRTTVNGVMLNE